MKARFAKKRSFLSYHDATDAAQRQTFVGLEEAAGSQLQGEGRHKATNDLSGHHWNGGQTHQEHHNVGDEQTWTIEARLHIEDKVR